MDSPTCLFVRLFIFLEYFNNKFFISSANKMNISLEIKSPANFFFVYQCGSNYFKSHKYIRRISLLPHIGNPNGIGIPLKIKNKGGWEKYLCVHDARHNNKFLHFLNINYSKRHTCDVLIFVTQLLTIRIYDRKDTC